MQKRYSPINQTLHWVTALRIFTILPLAWVMTNMPRDASSRADLFAWHETIGLVILFITGCRIVRRIFDGPPPYPARVARWERGLARATHWLLFLVLLWMPITGYLTASYGGHRVKLFDVVLAPALLPKNDEQQKLFVSLHLFGNGLYTYLLCCI